MNKSQKIYLNTGSTGNIGDDKYIIVKLEQDVKTLEFLTLNISTEDAYQNFNADYGVLVGRVLANGGIGVPNAKISIFIPLTDADANDGDIYSVYPYTTPRDKNNEGKRYNLLPRVAQLNAETNTYKPKQPFGSFPIKPEIVVNETLLNVYKKYYKYTALTNSSGDYMIFGVPTGVQTVHLSVDITDIGKYSMTPASMIIAGYPANLFIGNGTIIKPSQDLTDLPNIETQEISVNIIPFWGDTTNFEIGITRQDFRIKAVLASSFTIFGTTMTMGLYAQYGNPDKNTTSAGFYAISQDVSLENNIDIRVNRLAPPTIQLFTYTNDIPIDSTDSSKLLIPDDIDYNTQIRELDISEYFEYNVNGNFSVSVACNRRKVITDENGLETVVDDNYSSGVFTRFYGMMLIQYPDVGVLPDNAGFGKKFNGGNPCHATRGRLKIPQSHSLYYSEDNAENNLWRQEYMGFNAGEIYSVAQFFPTRKAVTNSDPANAENTTNSFTGNYKAQSAGAWFKVSGDDLVTQTEQYDSYNYIINPLSGSSPHFLYDMSPNVLVDFYNTINGQKAWYFGAQWLNFCLIFPQIGWAWGSASDRSYHYADVFFRDWAHGNDVLPFIGVNNQKLFAGVKDSSSLLRGDSFQTAFINVSKTELGNLLLIPYKGINVNTWNNDKMFNIIPKVSDRPAGKTTLGLNSLNADIYKYLPAKKTTDPNTPHDSFNMYGWDDLESVYVVPVNAKNKSAYLFKGMYGNDCIKMLNDLNII